MFKVYKSISATLHAHKLTRSRQSVLIAQILPHIRLVECYYVCGSQFVTLGRRLGRHSETEGNISHREDNDTLVLRSALRDAAQSGFKHMVAVQEGHFLRRLHPNFVLSILRQQVKAGHVYAKFLCLCELHWTARPVVDERGLAQKGGVRVGIEEAN